MAVATTVQPGNHKLCHVVLKFHLSLAVFVTYQSGCTLHLSKRYCLADIFLDVSDSRWMSSVGGGVIRCLP